MTDNGIEKVIEAVRTIRIGVVAEEFEIHRAIAAALNKAGIDYHHEHKLGPRCRIDFLTSSGIGIEVKKGKPYSVAVEKQLERYARFDAVKGIILVIERYQDVPAEVAGKPCRSLGLRKLWGIAL
ncbi:hypothetical protein [Paenibacillus agri]|uniref:DUF4143 domain-containing protein n=1 Tax=Paenibacillus agri TaxID=2744309 RepID=A0A850ESA5_9BACL|nr:hypothetical protein [Paenibacillus agri]NUU62670.1 hypothetical protein [Paenibacillus agri]